MASQTFVPKKKAARIFKNYRVYMFDLAFRIVAYPSNESASHWQSDLDQVTVSLKSHNQGYRGMKNYSYDTLMEELWDDNVLTYSLFTLEYYGPTDGPFDLMKVKKLIEDSVKRILAS